MYILKTEQSFDSAHFLADYKGKCRNIHGHRWRVIVEVQTEQLETEKQLRGMYVDFSTLKADLAEITDALDHALLVEEGTLRAKTLEALKEEDFRMVFVDFRPTAENFSRYFYQKMKEKGYDVKCATVYETPANSASYTE
jgi:6-pyruvoyltetrahydropterin/6-carboxytetrahydropterin synthase